MLNGTMDEAPALLAYVRLLLRLDDLMRQGKGNEAEADAIRDQMEEPWYSMTAQERELAGGLSEDLYALTEGNVASIDVKEEAVRWGREVRAAVLDLKSPDQALSLLRQPIPTKLPAYLVPFLQARTWERLGCLEVAVRFMNAAAKSNPNLSVCVLLLLNKLGHFEDAQRCAARILADDRVNPESAFATTALQLLQ